MTPLKLPYSIRKHRGEPFLVEVRERGARLELDLPCCGVTRRFREAELRFLLLGMVRCDICRECFVGRTLPRDFPGVIELFPFQWNLDVKS